MEDFRGRSRGLHLLLFRRSLRILGPALATYVLPFAVAAAAVVFVIWRMHRKDVSTLSRDLEQARTLVEQRERERDLAQEELFRRLYEERELNKEKMQFQSQLAEYEKYAALA